MRREPLPIDAYLDEICAAVRDRRAAVVVAPPGTGKTTRVPPALVSDGPVLLLQPRRIAARAIASRIASERGWTLGEEVGWHVRFDRRFGAATRLIVATEGILTARLQQDPLASAFRTLIVDEFHERSIHADLGVSLAREAWRARKDLRLVVMSATLDAEQVAAYLHDCPVVTIAHRAHSVAISYAPGQTLASAVYEVSRATPGDVLCFLPGAPEIRRALGDIRPVLDPAIDVVPLHGSLDSAEQDAVLRAGARRRVVLATNIAETSLTVPAVTAVVDAGLHKVARYDPDRAIDSLTIERISQDAADQRAGRAGRIGPGFARRLWRESDRLAPHREPEIARVDLSGALLDVIAWGGDPRRLGWFESPPPDRIEAGLALLARLGAIEGVALTALGRRMQRLGLHPRLARILIDAQGAPDAARICALLSERHYLAPRTSSTSSDLLSALDEWPRLPPHVRHAAEQIEQLARLVVQPVETPMTELDLRRAVLAGYPDRVGRRRAPGSPRVVLASGHGAVLTEQSGVRDGEFVVAVDVHAGARGAGAEARIRVASRVEREWLSPNAHETTHAIDPATGNVRAIRTAFYDRLPLGEQIIAPDPEQAALLLASAYLGRQLSEADERLIRRARFAGELIDLPALVERAAVGARRLDDIDLWSALDSDERRRIDRMAPETLAVPSGRKVRLEYEADGSVLVSVKLQEVFGLTETPRVGPGAQPVTLRLLAPNGRPVQVTRDLRSFWDRTYPQIRNPLRARYPKHPWPDDPRAAAPTGGVRRRQD